MWHDRIKVVKRQTPKVSAIVIVLLSGAAWLAISNHCALSILIAGKTHSATAVMHCHGNQQPVPSKKSGDEEMPCCKVLRATVAKDPTVVPGLIKLAQPTDYAKTVESVWSSALPHARLSNELDTGPPFVSSFAELILQRSLFAHAPPSLV